MKLSFHVYDVFTSRRFAGNPLAIVEGADGLATAAMQTIAREFNLSETIFVQTPDDPAHTAKVRIFFPTAEIPFAGHPTIGCAIHLATKDRAPGQDFETLVTLEEAAGLVPVKVWRNGGEVRAQFTAPVLPAAIACKLPEPDLAARALGLEPDRIGFDSHAIAMLAGGPGFLYVPLASREDLARAKPYEPHWSAMFEGTEIEAAYLYCRDEGGFSARMYAPGNGIPEDPATGSASAILAAQLLASGELREGLNRFALRQGDDMGRPSRIGLEIDVADGVLAAVRIDGSAVPFSSGTLFAD